MKCPKCNKTMELVFNHYKCYHCNPTSDSDTASKTDIDIDIITREDFEGDILDWDEWGNYD